MSTIVENRELELTFELMGNSKNVEKNKKTIVFKDENGNVVFTTLLPNRDGDFDLLKDGKGTVSGDYYIGARKNGKNLELLFSLNLFESHEDKSYVTLKEVLSFTNLSSLVIDNEAKSSDWKLRGMNPEGNTIIRGAILKKGVAFQNEWLEMSKGNKLLPELKVKVGDRGDENVEGNLGIRGKIIIPYTVMLTSKNGETPVFESTNGSNQSARPNQPSERPSQPSTPPKIEYTKPETVVFKEGIHAIPFEIIGGIGNFVKNHPTPSLNLSDLSVAYGPIGNYKGDDDIMSKDGKDTGVDIHLGVRKNDGKLELGILYVVKQLHGDKTVLSIFKKIKENPLSSFESEDDTQKIWWEFNGPTNAIVSDVFKRQRHDWRDIRSNSTMIDNIRVKIDGSGVETKEGNLGIKGTIYVDYKIMKTYKSRPIEAEPTPPRMIMDKPTDGNYSTINIPSNVRTILGHGMYISGKYASIDGDSLASKVYDLDKLNSFKRINENKNGKTDTTSVNAEGSTEYSKEHDENLSINVGLKYNALSFSQEVKKSFSEERYNKDSYKMITKRDVTWKSQYQVDGYKTLDKLTPFLSNDFLGDLNRYSADRIIEIYGTHIIMGMRLGGRYESNYSYLNSISKSTTVKTFSSKTSLRYNMDSNGNLKEETDKSKVQENVDKKLNAGDVKGATQIIEDDTKLKEAKSKNEKVTSQGFGVNLGFEFSTKDTIKNNMELQSFLFQGFAVGGNHSICGLINDSKDLAEQNLYKKEWLNSINNENAAWCDYIPGTIIPIYEVIPEGYKVTRATLKSAYEKFILKNCAQGQTLLGKGVHSQAFEIRGSQLVENLNSDNEISSQSGKETFWEIKLELINIEGGKIGVAVWYTVKEGGRASNRTVLQLKDVVNINAPDRSYIAVDEIVKNSEFKFEGTYAGQEHGWIRATNQARVCDFLDTRNHEFYVKIDGPGNDMGNIGIKGVFKIPYQFYNTEVRTSK